MTSPVKSFVVTGATQGASSLLSIHLSLLRGSKQIATSDATVAVQVTQIAESRTPLVGWVNNAAVFKDAQLRTTSADDVLRVITLNLSLSLIGCHAAINHFIAKTRPGAIVNVSSHQAQRPVRGALPYAVAKAALEGLTRAAAVDYGQYGIRVNAVALGSIDTERYQQMRLTRPDRIHPLGRVGRCEEVANVVEMLLGDECSFVSGTAVPVDGGRSAQGMDPGGV